VCEVVIVKLAVTFLAAFIVSVSGLVLPVKLPDQLPNPNPLAGTAVRVTAVPALYQVASGERVILPSCAGHAGVTEVVRLYCVVQETVTVLGASIRILPDVGGVATY
jgi:hypothetical protein